ncbi:Gamma-aminobutyric acid receptor alpha-like [Armadillidium vulgare]|nr:Gamma-aminobutyric acid receptor alpha-like [Armadillidium vulgare]
MFFGLTIQASCPMNLENFPMDTQRCPLTVGSFGYTTKDVLYKWNEKRQLVIAADMKLSQFDLIAAPSGFTNTTRRYVLVIVLVLVFAVVSRGRRTLHIAGKFLSTASYGQLLDSSLWAMYATCSSFMGLFLVKQRGNSRPYIFRSNNDPNNDLFGT